MKRVCLILLTLIANFAVVDELTGNPCSDALIGHVRQSSVRFEDLGGLRALPDDDQMRLVLLRSSFTSFATFNFSDFNSTTFAPNIARLGKFTTFDRHTILEVLAGTGAAWHRYLDAKPELPGTRMKVLALTDLAPEFQRLVRVELFGMIGNYEGRMYNVLKIRRMLEEINGRSVVASGELHMSIIKLIDHVFGDTPNAAPLKSYVRILSFAHDDGLRLPFDAEAQSRLFQALNKIAKAADVHIDAENNLANERLLLEALLAQADSGR